jgi:hypothetical protein
MPEVFTIDQIFIDAYRRKTISAYNRLEVSPRTADFNRSLKAEIRDPLWMLTRQWQLGELKGEDAASAVTTEISRQHKEMDRINFPGNHNFIYNDNIPLEAIVERQTPAADLSISVRLCIHFIRLMKQEVYFQRRICKSCVTSMHSHLPSMKMISLRNNCYWALKDRHSTA